MKLFNRPLLLFTLFLFLSGCMAEKKKVTILISNPSDIEASIDVDLTTVKIPPNKTEKYALKAGTHVFISGTDTVSRNITEDKKYLLNPTRSTYILEEYRFSKSLIGKSSYEMGMASKKTKGKIPFGIIMIEDTIPIVGAFKEIKNQLLIEGFDFNINEEVPNVISVENDFIKEMLKVKLYNWDDFMVRAEALSPILQMRKGLNELELSQPTVKGKPSEKDRLDYLNKRKELLSQPLDSLPKKKAKSDTRRMAIMEINSGAELLTLAINADNKITLISTSEKYDNKAVTSDFMAIFFYSAFMREYDNSMEKTSEFPLPKENEVRFHTWREDKKHTGVVSLGTVLSKQSSESRVGFANVNNLSDLYITGEKILKELK